MKFFIGIVVAAVALNCCVLALPARSPSDDAELIDVPPRPQRPRVNEGDDTAVDFNDFKGVIDTGSGYPFLQPIPHPFSFNMGFFDSFEDIFRRLRTRFWPIELPGEEREDGENDGSGFAFNLNPKKGNTTSTVKVVDGHKIEINDTTFGDEGSLFKVRVVNIRPLESGEDVEDTVATSHNNNNNNNGSPVTSAPAAAGAPGKDAANNDDDIDDESDERREPLEKKKPAENEIDNDNIDPEARERKQATKKATQDRAAQEVEDQLWKDDDKSLAKKQQRKEERKRAKVTRRKAEALLYQMSSKRTQVKQPLSASRHGGHECRSCTCSAEIAIAMLPTTTETAATFDEADVANLNAEFVTDNTLESGSAEAETNRKADDANMKYQQAAEDYEEEGDSALVAELNDEDAEDDGSSLAHNEQLTVEEHNNGDEDEPEVADNEAVQLTKDMNTMQLTQQLDDQEERAEQADDEAEAEEEAAKLTSQLNEETDKDIDAVVSSEFDAESISITHENHSEEEAEHAVDEFDVEHDGKKSSMKHSNYAANKQREDVSSSDDEAELAHNRPLQMHPQFNAEWDSLGDDLAGDTNDLSNDIDIYDEVHAVDLSNDLAVNDIAASQPGFPLNPDAEFVDVDGVIAQAGSLGPKFEKLSLGGAALNSTSYQQSAKYSQNFK